MLLHENPCLIRILNFAKNGVKSSTIHCTQHCSNEINFPDSGEMCSGVVILSLVLALVLAQEMQDNMPQPLIHVRLTHQVSHYNH